MPPFVRRPQRRFNGWSNNRPRPTSFVCGSALSCRRHNVTRDVCKAEVGLSISSEPVGQPHCDRRAAQVCHVKEPTLSGSGRSNRSWVCRSSNTGSRFHGPTPRGERVLANTGTTGWCSTVELATLPRLQCLSSFATRWRKRLPFHPSIRSRRALESRDFGHS